MALFVLQDGYRVVTTESGGRVVHLRTGDALALTPSELQLLARATTGGLDPHDRDIRPLVKKFAGLGVLVPVPPEPATPAPEPAPEEPLADRPVPLFRGDLKVSRRAGGAVFEVSDPKGSRSYSLYDFELSVARMLDGRRTADQVVTSAARLGIPCDRQSLQQFIRQLARFGFLAPAGALASPPDDTTTWGPRRTWDEGLRSLYQSGLKMFRQGRYAEAVSYFEAMLGMSAENPEATEMLAESRQRLKAVLAVTTGPLGREPAATAPPAVPVAASSPLAPAPPPATPVAAHSPLAPAPPAAPFAASAPLAPAPPAAPVAASARSSSATGDPFVDLVSSPRGVAARPLGATMPLPTPPAPGRAGADLDLAPAQPAGPAAPTPWDLPTELSALPPTDELLVTPAPASAELVLDLAPEPAGAGQAAPAAWTLATEVAALPGPDDLHGDGAAPPAWALPTQPGASLPAAADFLGAAGAPGPQPRPAAASPVGADLLPGDAPADWALPAQPAASMAAGGDLPTAAAPWGLPAGAAAAWPAAEELSVEGVPVASAVPGEPAAAPAAAGELAGGGEVAADEFFAAGTAASPEGAPAAAAPLFPEQQRQRPARSLARTLLMFGLPAVLLLGAGAIASAFLLGWIRLPGEPAPAPVARGEAAPDGAAAPEGAAPVAAAPAGAAPAAEPGEAAAAADGAAPAVAAAAMPGPAAAAAPAAAGWRSSTFVKRGRVTMATLRAARPGVVHWEAAPEQSVGRKARLGELQTVKGVGLPLVTAKAGLFLPRLEEGANAKPGAVLADVVYIEGFVQVTVPAPAPALTAACEVVDEAGGRTAPCKIVKTVKKPGGFLVFVTAEPLWIDSGTVSVRFAAP